AYWDQQYFAGIFPPSVLSSGAAVKRYVAADRAAIGYIEWSEVGLRARRAQGRVIPVGKKSPRAHACGALGRPPAREAAHSALSRVPTCQGAVRLDDPRVPSWAALSRAARDGVLQELAASMSRVRRIPREASPQKKGPR